MKNRNNNGDARRGSVLILCLWVLLFLSGLAVAIGSQVSAIVRVAVEIRAQNRCVDLARAGAELAIAQVCLAGAASATNAPELFKDNRSLSEGVFSVSWESRTDKGFETLWGVQAEAGKVNLNAASAQEMGRLLVDKAGLDKTQSDAIAACILDWRDPNEEELTGGAEGAYYRALITPYPCHNGSFDVAEELMLVKGMTGAIFARIRPYVTVYRPGAFGGRVVGQLVMAGGVPDDASRPGPEARVEFVCDDKGRKLYWHEY